MRNKFGSLIFTLLLTKLSFALIAPTTIQIQRESKQILNQYNQLLDLYDQLKNNPECVESQCPLLKEFEEKSLKVLQRTSKLTQLIMKVMESSGTDNIGNSQIFLAKRDLSFLQTTCSNDLKEYQKLYKLYNTLKIWDPERAKQIGKKIWILNSHLQTCKKLWETLKYASKYLNSSVGDLFKIFSNLERIKIYVKAMTLRVLFQPLGGEGGEGPTPPWKQRDSQNINGGNYNEEPPPPPKKLPF